MVPEVRVLDPAQVETMIEELARLRITVFRDWPYLYDGDLDYERGYLRPYVESPGAVVVGAFDGERLVGAATGTPIEDHADEFSAPLSGLGLPLDSIFYCAESVLLPEYRGRGAGHRFFDLREDRARSLGRSHAVFCAVERPADHPLRPKDYRPLDTFWSGRGYARAEGACARFSWKDVDQPSETQKSLQVWWRRL